MPGFRRPDASYEPEILKSDRPTVEEVDAGMCLPQVPLGPIPTTPDGGHVDPITHSMLWGPSYGVEVAPLDPITVTKDNMKRQAPLIHGLGQGVEAVLTPHNIGGPAGLDVGLAPRLSTGQTTTDEQRRDTAVPHRDDAANAVKPVDGGTPWRRDNHRDDAADGGTAIDGGTPLKKK